MMRYDGHWCATMIFLFDAVSAVMQFDVVLGYVSDLCPKWGAIMCIDDVCLIIRWMSTNSWLVSDYTYTVLNLCRS